MGEVDYQLALLLQHQFEQEFKKSRECSSDLQLARTLQEQFEREVDIDKPKQDLVYEQKQNRNNLKSLTDPSWEVVDPTPDIHILFTAFNERFFWNKLLAVCVSWSKRMTSCAGICSYQGRGGLCSITLSEPLLKLRPRKDLVETLLHEMIHAYLFVTHNNKDRDGHGPEFHKHMYRINATAGTNITVYHDFHDEVRLYQQHWWRCDGPCQNRKPYFGMVRRAMNRAPGPQDRWWGDHMRSCGGNFIKVKEPEKLQKKSAKSPSSKENKKPMEDIRKFLPSVAKTNTTKNMVTSTNNKNQTKVHTISDTGNSTPKISPLTSPKVSNIFGFTNLNGSSSKSSPNGNRTAGGTLRNSSNTIVINKTQKTSAETNASKGGELIKADKRATSTSGKTLTDTTKRDDNFDYSTVRNHWVNKYASGNSSSSIKRSVSEQSDCTQQSKVPKLSPNASYPSSSNLENGEPEVVECPVCMKQVQNSQLNAHLDICLKMSKDTKKCVSCNKEFFLQEYEKHVGQCAEENRSKNDLTTCAVCDEKVPTKTYNCHITMCIRDLVDDLNEPKESVVDLTCDNLEQKQCAVCEKNVPKIDYDTHAEKCLLQMYNDMESTYSDKEESVECLACGKTIIKSNLSLHLEDCMSLSEIFVDENEPKEGETSEDGNGKADKYNCPFCMALVSELEMSAHINVCLDIKEGST